MEVYDLVFRPKSGVLSMCRIYQSESALIMLDMDNGISVTNGVEAILTQLIIDKKIKLEWVNNSKIYEAYNRGESIEISEVVLHKPVFCKEDIAVKNWKYVGLKSCEEDKIMEFLNNE